MDRQEQEDIDESLAEIMQESEWGQEYGTGGLSGFDETLFDRLTQLEPTALDAAGNAESAELVSAAPDAGTAEYSSFLEQDSEQGMGGIEPLPLDGAPRNYRGRCLRK